tara:strand:+ start:9114 stop:10808 length:1695 start_codon:yes stop_codon:yes gene_type:complete
MLKIKSLLIYITLLLIFLFPIIEIFYPFVTNEIIIINEFLDIPISVSNNIEEFPFYNEPLYLNATIEGLHLAYKILIGYFFHHHMNFLIPAFELYENFNTSIHQYGILTSIIIGGLSKIFYGDISLNSYFSVLYSMYIIFYVLIFYTLWKILNNKILLIPAGLTLYLFIYIVGFESYYMTPTLNPIRQLLFPIIFLLSHYYLKNYKSKYFYQLIIILFLSYFINTQFTLLFVLSLIVFKIAILFIDKLKDVQKRHLKIIFYVFLIILGINFTYSFNYSNSFSEYFVILGPELKVNSYLLLLFFVSVLPSICIRVSNKNNFQIITLLSIYFGFSMIYYVWNPSMNHFSPIVWPWVIIVVLFCDEIYNEKIVPNHQIFIFLLVAFSLTCYESRANFFMSKRNYYDKVVDISKTYEWKTKKSMIKSTVNNVYIDDACSLFNKYSYNGEVTMLSLHDSYLPFVCGYKSKNYSTQVALNLPTKKEENELIEYFMNNDIEFIFVDKLLLDIDKNSEFDLNIIKLSGPVGVDRIIHLKYFSEITKKIVKKYNYKIKDEGEKIVVFVRTKDE